MKGQRDDPAVGVVSKSAAFAACPPVDSARTPHYDGAMGRLCARFFTVIGIGFTFGVVAGCGEPVARVTGSYYSDRCEQSSTIELAPFLTSSVPATRIFLRTNPDAPTEPPTTYEQREESAGRVGGSLVGRVEWPLAQYFDRDSNRPNRPRIPWPIGDERAVEAFLIEFDPPIAEWPTTIHTGEPVEAMTRMRAYDRWGIPFADGAARRWVRFGGFEEVVVGETRFADCLRLEADTNLWFGWWAFVSLRETVWLARERGLVRRIERINGNALLIFRFDSVHEYQLLDAARPTTLATATANDNRPSPGRWARLAICLNRGTPRPRIGGLAVEFSRSPQ